MNSANEHINKHFFAVIPAGGIGSRLWPLSRAAAPKFLHDLTGSGQTLLQDTWDRLLPLAKGRIMVVTGNIHAQAVEEQLPELDLQNIILEPTPRDSTAAIALAAAVLAQRDPDVIIGSFAADHVILDQALFEATVKEAIEVAATGKIVTIGLRPTEPSVAFGYIHKGERLSTKSACEVLNFVEKPNIKIAKQYVDSGDYFWNAGMYIAPAKLLLEVLKETEPELHESIMALASAWGTKTQESEMAKRWDKLKKIAIDYAIAEPAAKKGLVAVVPGEFEWHDVGDFASIAELQSQGRKGNLAVLGHGRVLADSSSGILVSDTGRLVALIGLEDVIVVDTPDALLITTKEHAQKVKSLVDVLKASGHSELL
ncbi:MAG: NTP transferase domain-containing protein [Aquiluna sp.]|nr:NTP transferase domain-containing protein [Aquiluna sp.]MCF8546240.1 NTP transferase domain-containing protein [Aquiluna sp.]